MDKEILETAFDLELKVNLDDISPEELNLISEDNPELKNTNFNHKKYLLLKYDNN